MDMTHGEPIKAGLRLWAWGGTTALALLPLFILKLIDPGAWEVSDLPFALIMIGVAGFAFEFAVRVPAHRAYFAAITLAFGASALLILGNLAVGFIGSEDNPLNMMYPGLVGVAAAGALLARLRPFGLSIVMAVAAALQLAAGIVALFYGAFTGPLTILFMSVWLAAAWLFRKAAFKQGGDG